MKKTLILLLAIAMTLSLMACGSPSATQNDPPENSQTLTVPPRDTEPATTQPETTPGNNTPDADPSVEPISEWEYSIAGGPQTPIPAYVIIRGYNGSDTHIEIPAMLEDAPVKTIADRAFMRNTSIVNVIIPEGVTKIERQAFKECTSLVSITLPESLQIIDSEAFMDCTSLTSITIPESVERIEEHAFANCASLSEIIIPENANRDSLKISGRAFINTAFSEEIQNMLRERIYLHLEF